MAVVVDARVGQVLYSLNTQLHRPLRTRFLIMPTLRRLVQCRQMDRIQRVVLHIPWRRTLELWLALVTTLLVGTLWLMAQELRM